VYRTQKETFELKINIGIVHLKSEIWINRMLDFNTMRLSLLGKSILKNSGITIEQRVITHRLIITEFTNLNIEAKSNLNLHEYTIAAAQNSN